MYNGLVYSESQDGSYCKFCVLFGKCESSVNEFGVLVVRPLTNFKKACEKLSEHFIYQTQKGKIFHQCAVTEAATFISVMECEALRIDNRINAERAHSQFSFFVALILSHNVLSYTKGLMCKASRTIC